MKKLTIILLLFIACLQVRAVDYGALEVKVRTHPDQYKELLDRFIAADTTLTPEQVSEVYYGFAFTPSYEPTDTFPEVHAALAAHNYGEVARLAEEALQLNPVSLEMSMIALAAYENGAGDRPGYNARRMAIRRDAIIGAICDSGKGTRPGSPFFVISESDRKTFMFNVLGVGEVLGTSGVGDNITAYKFIFSGRPRLHFLYFDESLEKNFKKN